jgi:hypothetical protein
LQYKAREAQPCQNNKTRLAVQGGSYLKFGSRRDAVPDFKIDMSLPAFDFYEGADLTASGRPLKTDKQITPPLINAAPQWNG